MLETYTIAFTTFFATIGPLDVVAIFIGLTATSSAASRRAMAIKGSIIATLILVFFALVGQFILDNLGISLAALKVAGGILLLLIGIDLVFSPAASAAEEESQESDEKQDISVFPLATPLIGGPGAMGAAILLMADNTGHWGDQGVVILALVSVTALTLVLLLLANRVQQLFGLTGMHVISRVFGVLLTALAVQFMFDGIKQSGLLGS
ncbi:MarC family protein [Pelagibaculum spongiae]|uniref:UPF0056 membrane protein n=1 Tax=Pelagibaculum spongiae TaxID=2080658 RepID=A0A2V1GX66_9GAMM|nr:MarC family protein [Pelagibaculum spongiae]PVZ70610.1 antibiotic resistance protein MarC [Pelagibaculum spongiae]